MGQLLSDDSRLYDALLDLFKSAPEKWWSSHEVINHPTIERFLKVYDNKRISNYLGNLYRRGTLRREGAGLHGFVDGSKYAFTLSSNESQSSLLVNKPNLRIADDGKHVTIELSNFIITIQQR